MTPSLGYCQEWDSETILLQHEPVATSLFSRDNRQDTLGPNCLTLNGNTNPDTLTCTSLSSSTTPSLTSHATDHRSPLAIDKHSVTLTAPVHSPDHPEAPSTDLSIGLKSGQTAFAKERTIATPSLVGVDQLVQLLQTFDEEGAMLSSRPAALFHSIQTQSRTPRRALESAYIRPDFSIHVEQYRSICLPLDILLFCRPSQTLLLSSLTLQPSSSALSLKQASPSFLSVSCTDVS
ncbi:unnamed protein product [Protopolystoma xenopodis]|uniref:Uncharacterized protein n=1 Tax=Protopolystoma xenopodis TaxID=117903 RepID=A0A3S5B896_9PLAT|nr:unnamed protein product [Protopolystoma xenopodis]